MKYLLLLSIFVGASFHFSSIYAGFKMNCMDAIKGIASKNSIEIREDFLMKNSRRGFDRVNLEAFSDLDYVKIMFPDRVNGEGIILGTKLENVAQVNILEVDQVEVFEIIFDPGNKFSYFKLDSSGIVNIDTPRKFRYSRTYYTSNVAPLRTPKSYVLESKDGYNYSYNVVERRHSTFIQSNDSVIEFPDYEGSVIDINPLEVKGFGEVLKVSFDEDATKPVRFFQYDHSSRQIVELNGLE